MTLILYNMYGENTALIKRTSAVVKQGGDSNTAWDAWSRLPIAMI